METLLTYYSAVIDVWERDLFVKQLLDIFNNTWTIIKWDVFGYILCVASLSREYLKGLIDFSVGFNWLYVLNIHWVTFYLVHVQHRLSCWQKWACLHIIIVTIIVIVVVTDTLTFAADGIAIRHLHAFIHHICFSGSSGIVIIKAWSHIDGWETN